MNRIGMCKIMQIENGETYECFFPETKFRLPLQTVSVSVELKNKAEFKKIFGYRFAVEVELIRLHDSFYKNTGIDIYEQFLELAKILNRLAEMKIDETNREIIIYPDFKDEENDLYIKGILAADSIEVELSGIVNNVGQKLSLMFYTEFPINGETYSPDEEKSFYLPDYLGIVPLPPIQYTNDYEKRVIEDGGYVVNIRSVVHIYRKLEGEEVVQ